MDFEFKGEVVKFDDTEFYTLFKSYQPNGKGVDSESYRSIYYSVKEKPDN